MQNSTSARQFQNIHLVRNHQGNFFPFPQIAFLETQKFRCGLVQFFFTTFNEKRYFIFFPIFFLFFLGYLGGLDWGLATPTISFDGNTTRLLPHAPISPRGICGHATPGAPVIATPSNGVHAPGACCISCHAIYETSPQQGLFTTKNATTYGPSP